MALNVGLLCLLFVHSAAALIPRTTLFGDNKYSGARLSPDGKHIGYLHPNGFGIMNVHLQCIHCTQAEAKPVTFERKTHIMSFHFTGLSDIILYATDDNGDENAKLYKINITDPSDTFAISDKPGVQAQIVANDEERPYVGIGLNDETPAFHNIYRFDLRTNRLRLMLKNERFMAPMIVFDNDLRIRLAAEEDDSGALVYFKPSRIADPESLTSDPADWERYYTVDPEDRPLTHVQCFTPDNKRLYWLRADGTDLGQLVVHDFAHPTRSQLLYRAQRSAITGVAYHPRDQTLLFVVEFFHKPEIYVANSTVIDDVQRLVNLRPDAAPFFSFSMDFNIWLVSFVADDRPGETFIYDRREKRSRFMFADKPDLAAHALNKMVGFEYAARDGLRLQAYLSLPPTTRLRTPEETGTAEDAELARTNLLPSQPQKLILLVHGGPKARDYWGFSQTNAWLTDRGYAVMQINFRGSVGFGKRLTNAGDGEWGRRMHEDLLDGVEFAVRKGIARRDEIAIMGGSYGGYATLAALSFTPDVFRCGVDIVGPSSLITLLETIPPYWLGFYRDMVKMFGADKSTDAGKEFLRSRSPLYFADRVRKPLLIIHGSNDPRVRQAESDRFVEELKLNGIPVTYAVFPDEGHGPRKPENVLAMHGLIEEFLHDCLHGQLEPFRLGQYNSTARLVADARRRSNSTAFAVPQLSAAFGDFATGRRPAAARRRDGPFH